MLVPGLALPRSHSASSGTGGHCQAGTSTDSMSSLNPTYQRIINEYHVIRTIDHRVQHTW